MRYCRVTEGTCNIFDIDFFHYRKDVNNIQVMNLINDGPAVCAVPYIFGAREAQRL